ncbi:hypothetical protein AX14_013292 [Amanita brunnescens Koide BX004]|nr:hypothetical protein AX14_013292 [Amanita brunnescens Koide BX004]
MSSDSLFWAEWQWHNKTRSPTNGLRHRKAQRETLTIDNAHIATFLDLGDPPPSLTFPPLNAPSRTLKHHAVHQLSYQPYIKAQASKSKTCTGFPCTLRGKERRRDAR